MMKITKFFFKPNLLSNIMNRENNNYDFLRLLAAVTVIIGHSYAIVGKEGWMDPIQKLIHFNFSGGVAVIVFFFFSGLFVTTSIQKNPSLLRFAMHRCFRIFPALIVALLITAYVIGSLFTTLSIKQYLSNPETISYVYRNTLLHSIQWRLPGVFEKSSYGINGSIWSLPLELHLYVLIFLLAALQLLKNRWAAVSSLVAVMVFSLMNKNIFCYFTQDGSAQYVFAFFLIGAICSYFRQWIVINLGGVLLFSLLLLLAWNTSFKIGIFYLWLNYLLLFIFQLKQLQKINLGGDYSYGVYIYGFPVQQVMNSLLPGHTPLLNLILSIPCALLLGVASWHWIEKPTIRLVSNI